MRSSRPLFFSAILLLPLAASCLKPAPVDATGNSGTGPGPSNTTTTMGGSGPNPMGGGAPVSGSSSDIPMGGAGEMRMAAACAPDANAAMALGYSPGYSIAADKAAAAKTMVQSLNVQQKATQMRGTAPGAPGNRNYTDIFRTPDDSNIKGFQFADGPRGVCLDPVKPKDGEGYATVFPVSALRGASWDLDLEYRIGQAMGDEMIAAGRTMLLAPTINILRHPAWARAQETYGEDSFLLGRFGTAFVTGVQEYGPACVKHYAANNIDQKREEQIAKMSDQTLREVYARQFGMVIRDGGVSCVMASYNKVQAPATAPAEHATENKKLLTDILRTEYNFQGFVMSDWWAMSGGQNESPQAGAYTTAAIKAGLDMELPWNLNFSQLESQVQNGAITPEQLATAATRIVTEKVRFNVATVGGPIGLKPPRAKFDAGKYSITDDAGHDALAYESALKGMVLLKNEASTLPLQPATAAKVAVVGKKVPWQLSIGGAGENNFAKDARIGDLGSSRVNLNPGKAVGPFAGIQAAAPQGATVTLDDSGGTQVAAAADVIVVVAGLTPEDEGEDYTIQPKPSDRGANLGLDGKSGTNAQNNYIKQLAGLGKPVVVVLEGGSAIDVSSFINEPNVKAVVMAWYPGQAGGKALGDLLWGNKNFSGKLAISWPASLAEAPPFKDSDLATTMDYYLGYRWYVKNNKKPLFGLGYGLSYTSFDYKTPFVSCSSVPHTGVVSTQIDIYNSGMKEGEDVAMVFVSWPQSKVAVRQSPGYKELKGFARTPTIAPGQGKRIEIKLRVSDLDYFNEATGKWEIEDGPVDVWIGPSLDKLPAMPSGQFTVTQ